MRTRQNNGGFTLVEFVITIAIASLITLAATTMLLLGLRIHHKSNTIAAQQNTVSMLCSVVDSIASEEAVTVPPDISNGWKICYGSSNIAYDQTEKSIKLNEAVFLENVQSSSLTAESNLLKLTIITEHNSYSFSVYCRKGVTTTG